MQCGNYYAGKFFDRMMKEAVKLENGRCLTEALGVLLENVAEVAETGVDLFQPEPLPTVLKS
jgi:nicotinate-nucleotide pyrophosphorylase